MPTYEYECKSCKHRFEIFQSIKASALRQCPECKKLTLQRLIGSGAGIIFKGSGFYETDYKRNRSGGGASSSRASKDSSSGTPESKKSDSSSGSSDSGGAKSSDSSSSDSAGTNKKD